MMSIMNCGAVVEPTKKQRPQTSRRKEPQQHQNKQLLISNDSRIIEQESSMTISPDVLLFAALQEVLTTSESYLFPTEIPEYDDVYDELRQRYRSTPIQFEDFEGSEEIRGINN